MARRPEITQVEILAAIQKPSLRIVERATVEGKDVRGHIDGEDIVIGKRDHAGVPDDIVLTAVHEILHFLRPDASERWVKHRELRWFSDDKVRAAVAIRLLGAALFPERTD